jgi:hypothetical protein
MEDNNIWSLKNETIKYCEQDCRNLYQIIEKFGKQILSQFKLDIHKYPNLTSLTLALFRKGFLDKETKIPLSRG